jgi:hypothetical protein
VQSEKYVDIFYMPIYQDKTRDFSASQELALFPLTPALSDWQLKNHDLL